MIAERKDHAKVGEDLILIEFPDGRKAFAKLADPLKPVSLVLGTQLNLWRISNFLQQVHKFPEVGRASFIEADRAGMRIHFGSKECMLHQFNTTMRARVVEVPNEMLLTGLAYTFSHGDPL